jgi:hypothetical protein
MSNSRARLWPGKARQRDTPHVRLSPRLIALIRKETRQMLRDRSNLMVGLLLPAALILLFGYGLSFDVRDAPVAVVLEDRSETARDAVAGLSGSPYLAPVAAPDMGRAVALLRAHTVDAIVRVPVDFTARKAAGEGRIQVLLNGYDATTAMTIGTYIDGAIQLSTLHDQDRTGPGVDSGGSLGLVQRVWFNAASISTWYLVPGLLVLVITLIGAFLTSLLIARMGTRNAQIAVRDAGPAARTGHGTCSLHGDRRDRRGALPRLGAVPVPCPDPWLARGHRRLLAALPLGLAHARAAHFGRNAEPVRGEPDGHAGKLHARNHAVGFRL